ncbi:MAG: tRNA (adenosine(37)-N6)-threonylcarbamoyltransferase complex ATPase subunit type 1 TsaE [Weeksellaceae bacterium]
MTFKIKSISELAEVAAEILQNLKFKIILFEGELGAGKTTLIKELLKQMNSSDQVSSPTFSIINAYDIPGKKVYHFDFYRIKSEEEALDFGTEEYLDSGEYCFIEWPDIIRNLLPAEFHTLKIQVEDGQRILNFV